MIESHGRLGYRYGCRCEVCIYARTYIRLCLQCQIEYEYEKGMGFYCSTTHKTLFLASRDHGIMRTYTQGCRCDLCSKAQKDIKNKGSRQKPCESCSQMFDYKTESARFCSNRCRAKSTTSRNSIFCSVCNGLNYRTRAKNLAYVCTKCKKDLPTKHGKSYYRKTGCRCDICRNEVNRYQREWCLKYFKKNNKAYSSSFEYEYWYVSQEMRFKIYERDGWQCQLCTEQIDFSSKGNNLSPTLDHIVCQSWTETPDHSTSNLRLVCKSCNSSRKNSPKEEKQWLLDPAGWELLHKRPSIDPPL